MHEFVTSQDTGSVTQHLLGLLLNPNNLRAEVHGPCLTLNPIAPFLKGNAIWICHVFLDLEKLVL